MAGVLAQVNIGSGGVPKYAVESAVVGVEGLAGDKHNHPKHGGPEKAVCLFSEELYTWLARQGMPVKSGDLAENFTLRGVDVTALVPGDRLTVGECEIEITRLRKPCATLDVFHKELPKILQGRSGWYAKVNRGGTIRPGDAVALLRSSR